ncbi:hypothetical protein I4U23_027626 [Adineta vaga]|nr:hypothetical protein I4U23_027626 [Adineta vaga]
MQQQTQRSLKDNGFINNSFSEFQETERTPISGYQNLPLQSLEQALEKVIPIVPDLGHYVGQAKQKCNRNDPILTCDESAAVYLYTMPTPFYSYLNKALRNENRQMLKPWFSFLRLIIHALEKLPSLETNVWREPVTIERIYPDGSQYIDNLKGSKRYGIGTYLYTNGEKYQGEWFNDQTNGKGTSIFPNGNRYEGDEKNGKRHEYGVCYWANGEKYEGTWSNDKMNGKGKYSWPEKNIQYEGSFKNDKKHGQGTLKYANGRIKQGIWEND